MKPVIFFLVLTLIFCKETLAQKEVSLKKDTSSPAIKFLKDWEKEFLTAGVSIEKDSLQMSEEAKKLMLDSGYRKSTYPAIYNWPGAIGLMKKMELKKAFWHLMNLYRTDTSRKELILQTFVLYDSLVDMQKTLVNSFYTYSMTDPEISIFKNGKPNIIHPDILEEKFNKMKEITSFILYYRSQKALNVQKEKA